MKLRHVRRTALPALVLTSSLFALAAPPGTRSVQGPQRRRHSLSSFQIDPAVGLDARSGDSIYELDAVSCSSTKLCAAVDQLGNLITFDPLVSATIAAGTIATTPVDPGNSLSSISCKPSGICFAVDRSGNAIADSTGSGSWQLQAISGAKAFSSVACPTTSECLAVDSAGNAFRLNPTG